MKEFIEKLIEKIARDTRIGRKSCDAIVQDITELAEEYNNGWIPCSERLPDIEHISGVSETVLVTTNNNSIFTAEYHGNGKWLDDVADWSLEVIAWQPLPPAYKEGCE